MGNLERKNEKGRQIGNGSKR